MRATICALSIMLIVIYVSAMAAPPNLSYLAGCIEPRFNHEQEIKERAFHY